MPDHEGVILAHEEKFKNINDRFERIEASLEKASIIVAQHVESGIDRIRKIDCHDIAISQLQKDYEAIRNAQTWAGRYLLGILYTLLGGILTLTVVLTQAFTSLHRLEILHPIPSKYIGEQGPRGITGDTGPRGDIGKTGLTGADGKDAR